MLSIHVIIFHLLVIYLSKIVHSKTSANWTTTLILTLTSYRNPVYVQLIIIFKCYLLICCLCFSPFLPPSSKVEVYSKLAWKSVVEEGFELRILLSLLPECRENSRSYGSAIELSLLVSILPTKLYFINFYYYSSVLKNTPSTRIHR